MVYSKAKLKIGGDNASPRFKQSSDSKISSSEMADVHCIVQSEPSWYNHGVALFTTLFHSNRYLDPEDFFNCLIIK